MPSSSCGGEPRSSLPVLDPGLLVLGEPGALMEENEGSVTEEGDRRRVLSPGLLVFLD